MPTAAAVAAKPSLTLKRRLNATPAQVFSAWTDPQKIVRWFGPSGATAVTAEVDARPGGHYHMTFSTPDGESHDISGVYREFVPDEKLKFTWRWITLPERESLVTITLRAEGDVTLLTLLHEQFYDEGARDRHEGGWTGTLDKLEQLFA